MMGDDWSHPITNKSWFCILKINIPLIKHNIYSLNVIVLHFTLDKILVGIFILFWRCWPTMRSTIICCSLLKIRVQYLFIRPKKNNYFVSTLTFKVNDWKTRLVYKILGRSAYVIGRYEYFFSDVVDIVPLITLRS